MTCAAIIAANRIDCTAKALDWITRQIDTCGQSADRTPAYRVRDYIRDTLRQLTDDILSGPASSEALKARILAHFRAEKDYHAFEVSDERSEDADGKSPVMELIIWAPSWWSEDLIETENTDPSTLGLAYQALFFYDADSFPTNVCDNIDSEILTRLLRAVAPLDLAAA